MDSVKDIAIRLNNVSKTFHIREKSSDTIKERFSNILKPSPNIKELKAVQNVSFCVNKGEFFGLVGHNGSGKSTLLKLIIGAIKPDNGSEIELSGKVLRLALGMGFDINLSARHNIYVNGSVMGLTFKEIGRRFNEIIDFAGLSEFIDTPLKFYSSGMISRLAFSISVFVETDILLIDEFFGGVGDEAFRQKSTKIFKERIISGKTVVFVSHDMGLINQYCNRVAVLEGGCLTHLGAPEDVVSSYLSTYEN